MSSSAFPNYQLPPVKRQSCPNAHTILINTHTCTQSTVHTRRFLIPIFVVSVSQRKCDYNDNVRQVVIDSRRDQMIVSNNQSRWRQATRATPLSATSRTVEVRWLLGYLWAGTLNRGGYFTWWPSNDLQL